MFQADQQRRGNAGLLLTTNGHHCDHPLLHDITQVSYSFWAIAGAGGGYVASRSALVVEAGR